MPASTTYVCTYRTLKYQKETGKCHHRGFLFYFSGFPAKSNWFMEMSKKSKISSLDKKKYGHKNIFVFGRPYMYAGSIAIYTEMQGWSMHLHYYLTQTLDNGRRK